MNGTRSRFVILGFLVALTMTVAATASADEKPGISVERLFPPGNFTTTVPEQNRFLGFHPGARPSFLES